MPGYSFGETKEFRDEILIFFGTLKWKINSDIGHDVHLIIDKSKARLEFGKELHRGRRGWKKIEHSSTLGTYSWPDYVSDEAETMHSFVAIIDLDPQPDPDFDFALDRFKVFHPETTQFTIEDETETNVTLHYNWPYEYVGIMEIPKPGELLMG